MCAIYADINLRTDCGKKTMYTIKIGKERLMTVTTNVNSERRTWMVRLDINGFRTFIMVYGTEREIMEYIESEIPSQYIRSYSGMSNQEVETAKKLKMAVYLAPELERFDTNRFK